MKHVVAITVFAALACLSAGCQDATGSVTVIPQGFSGKWSSVSVATARSCALADDGVAYCWGQRLVPPPTGGTDSVGVPTLVPGALTFTEVSTGVSFGTTPTCGLTSDGAAYCWGGLLGGTSDGKPGRVSVPSLTTLALDADLACGLAAGGEVYCWGPGLFVPLSSYDHSPVPVMPGVRLTSLAVGDGMVCGINTTGAAACGHQHSIYSSSPSAYADDFTSVVPGSYFVCGLRRDGQALCSTEAGIGVGGGWSTSSGLTPVLAPQPLVQLSVGGSRVCGPSADGTAYCWTVDVVVNGLGERGNVTTPVAVGGEYRFVQISVAETHACGLTAEGAIYCWGDNGAGELGNGSVGGSSDAPVRVSDPA
jgi:hypothetical protein